MYWKIVRFIFFELRSGQKKSILAIKVLADKKKFSYKRASYFYEALMISTFLTFYSCWEEDETKLDSFTISD